MVYGIWYSIQRDSIVQSIGPYSSRPRPAITAPMTDDPACIEFAAFMVGDADALLDSAVVVAAAAAAAADLEEKALARALALETIEPGAVRIAVGTDDGLTFVGATTMPAATVEALADVESSESEESELELETSVYSPVLRTV